MLSITERKLPVYAIYFLFLLSGFIQLLGTELGTLVLAGFELVLLTLLCLMFAHKKLLKWQALNKSITTVWIIWLVSALFSISHSYIFSEYDSFKYLLAYSRIFSIVVMFAFGVVIFRFFELTDFKYERAFIIVLAIILLIILNMLLVWNVNLDYRDSDDWFLQPPGYPHIRHGGYHVVVAIMLSFYFLLKNARVNKIYVPSIIVFIILWAFNFWMAGRGAIIGGVLGCIVALYLAKHKQIPIKKLSIIFVGSLVASFFLAEAFAVLPWNGLLGAVNRSVESGSAQELTSGRVALWLSSLKALEGNYWFGLGANSYRFIPGHIYGAHPHNLLVQFVLEWGVIGTILLGSVFIYLFWYGFKRFLLAKDELEILCISGALIVLLTAFSLVDGTFYHVQPQFFLMFAFIFWLNPFNKIEDTET